MKQRYDVDAYVERLGIALEPNGHFSEAEGIINPASARDRQGRLLLYPRMVAKGNVSRVGLVLAIPDGLTYRFERLGFALEPEANYELNEGGHGCEDPRVTFIAALDRYLMGYTACGPQGPRAAFAWSSDGYEWHRTGLAHFPEDLQLSRDDKDVVFFPEPVISPAGVESIAFYHRPMHEIPSADGKSEIQTILSCDADRRQSIRIAYVPLGAVRDDISNLTRVTESVLVMSPGESWGRIKLGGGTVPLRIEEGFLSLFHGVDMEEHADGSFTKRYRAGIVIHDPVHPHKVLYRSPAPVLAPETEDELTGTVNNVVFPTALEPAATSAGGHVFDVFYGMADYKIGLARLALDIRASSPQHNS